MFGRAPMHSNMLQGNPNFDTNAYNRQTFYENYLTNIPALLARNQVAYLTHCRHTGNLCEAQEHMFNYTFTNNVTTNDPTLVLNTA